ncbi:MAG: type 4a pilus biogenesis protein PilO, partial [Chitinispirillaceae bacterium]|nr:type 4a pilus biogenesis protein PilO [Chitinispirillaceae bacterium]
FQDSMHNLKLEKITKEAPLILFCGFTFFVVIVALKFAIIPLVYKANSLKEDLHSYKSLISSESGFLKIKEEIKTKIDSLQKIIDGLTEQKKGSIEISEYLEKLMEVARESDVKFVRIEPQSTENSPSTSNSEYILYPVLLALTTGYHEAGKFISYLEKKPHLFRVERIALEARKDEKCDIKILVTCLIPKEKGNNDK